MLCVFYYKYYELLELICNIDNFAVGKWFREVYAFRMKGNPVKIRDSTRCCESTKTDIELLPLV